MSTGQIDRLLQRDGGVRMQRDDPLGVALTDRNPQPRMPVWIAVEAIAGQPPHLVTAGTRPAQYQHCGALQRIGQLFHRAHEGVELMIWKVARHRFGSSRCVSTGQQWPTGDVVPSPDRGFAAERVDHVELVLDLPTR